MATSVTTTNDGTSRVLTTLFPAYRGDGAIGGVELLEVTVDSSKTVGLNVTGDTMTVATLPKNSQILAVQVLIDTTSATPDVLEGGTSTINIGDSGSATRFATGVNCNATANSLTYTTGTQYYSAADTLILTWASGTMKKARFRIRVSMVVYN